MKQRQPNLTLGENLPFPQAINMRRTYVEKIIEKHKVQGHEKCPYCTAGVKTIKTEYKLWEELAKNTKVYSRSGKIL